MSQPPFRTVREAFTASGCWVRSRRGALRSVSATSPFRTGLATFMASGSTPLISLSGFPRSVSLHFFSFDWCIPQSSCISEHSLRVRWYIQHSQKMHSLSTFAPIFSQARGLHHQFSSWCVRLSRTPITMPHPTPYEGVRVSYGSRLPTSTLFTIPHKVSRVHSVGLRHKAVGGVFLRVPSTLCGSPVTVEGTIRFISTTFCTVC
jgi:hypothetical protein